MSETKRKGRVTIPTDVDVVPETLEILERWGADAIRDCDGTDYPEALKSVGAAARADIFTLFPELAEAGHVPVSARVLPSGRLGRKLVVRHVRNGVALVN